MENPIKELFKKADEKGLKVVFGLEAQGHIPTIEAIIKRKQEHYNKSFPDDYTNVMYAKHVWDEIGKKIGWCSFTACLYYFRYLDKNRNE